MADDVTAWNAAALLEREGRARAVLAEHFEAEVGPAELAASARLHEAIARRGESFRVLSRPAS